MILHRQLHLLRAMVKGGPQTVEELAKDTGIGLRMVYRYLEQFRQVGVNLVKKGAYYNIDPNSPFLRDITNGFRFSEDEAITMLNVLNSVVDRTPQVRNLREKLSILHDSDIFAKYGVMSMLRLICRCSSRQLRMNRWSVCVIMPRPIVRR